MKKLATYIVCILVTFISCRNSVEVISEERSVDVLSKYAEVLKVPEKSIKDIKLYSFIDEWYGVKYSYGGLTMEGVDCSGFCNVLYSEVYSRVIARDTKSLFKEVEKVNKKDLIEGDLVFFNISNKVNSHVGIYLVNDQFVHASTSKGVIISSLENPYYHKSYNQGGRLK